MAITYNTTPFVTAYQNRLDPAQQKQTAWTDQSLQIASAPNDAGQITYSMPWQNQPYTGTWNPTLGMMEYKSAAPDKTWADYMYESNPMGIMNNQRLAGFNQIAGTSGFGGYSGLGVDAPINGTDAEKIAYMDLLNLVGTHQAGVQAANSADFMRDFGWALPIAAFAVPALASGAFGAAAGAGAAEGAAGALAGGLDPALAAGAGGMGIPELGMVANQATLNTAMAGGLPASMFAGGPGALTLEALGAGGAMDMGGSAGIFDMSGNPLYTSPAGGGLPGSLTEIVKTMPPGSSNILTEIIKREGVPGGSSNPLSWLSSLLGGGGAGGSGMWGTGASLLSLLGGLSGLGYGRDLEKTGAMYFDKLDPAKPIRDVAQPELIKLMNDPSSIVNRPGFAAGQLAIDRSLAKQGFNPANVRGVSGNYLDAHSNYAGNFYDKEMQRLMAMSQIGIGPQGGNIGLQGLMGGAGVTGASTQSILAGLQGLLRNLGVG